MKYCILILLLVVASASAGSVGRVTSEGQQEFSANLPGLQATGAFSGSTDIQFDGTGGGGAGVAVDQGQVDIDRMDPIMIIAEEDDEEVTVETEEEPVVMPITVPAGPVVVSPTTVNVDIDSQQVGQPQILAPLTAAVNPLVNAVQPITDAFAVPSGATVGAFDQGAQNILAAKATLAAPFVSLGSAVAAPFVAAGSKVVALIIKGKTIVGAKVLKLAALKGAAAGKIKAAAVALPAALAGKKVLIGSKILAGKSAVSSAFLAGKAAPFALAGSLGAAKNAAVGSLFLQPIGNGAFQLVPATVAQAPTIQFAGTNQLTIDHPVLQVDHTSNANFGLGPDTEQVVLVDADQIERQSQSYGETKKTY